jgi:hypothetical protein
VSSSKARSVLTEGSYSALKPRMMSLNLLTENSYSQRATLNTINNTWMCSLNSRTGMVSLRTLLLNVRIHAVTHDEGGRIEPGSYILSDFLPQIAVHI